MAQAEIGIIGGSGLYSMPGFTNQEEVRVETPFGDPSDAFVLGELEGHKVAFLARHGRGHRILPSELNFRANIYALKKLGVERILSVSAVGSLKEEHKPTDFVIPDQFIDRTFHRVSTFFGDGIVGHVAGVDARMLDEPERHGTQQQVSVADCRVRAGGGEALLEPRAFAHVDLRGHVEVRHPPLALGHASRHRLKQFGAWSSKVEGKLSADWKATQEGAGEGWERVSQAVRHGWDRAKAAVGRSDERR